MRKIARSILIDAETDPESARALWHGLLDRRNDTESLAYVFNAILQSAVVDYIEKAIHADDEDALIIGRRIAVMIRAIEGTQ